MKPRSGINNWCTPCYTGNPIYLYRRICIVSTSPKNALVSFSTIMMPVIVITVVINVINRIMRKQIPVIIGVSNHTSRIQVYWSLGCQGSYGEIHEKRVNKDCLFHGFQYFQGVLPGYFFFFLTLQIYTFFPTWQVPGRFLGASLPCGQETTAPPAVGWRRRRGWRG